MKLDVAIRSLIIGIILSINSASSSTCPMNLGYVGTIPWDSAACKEAHQHNSTACCQTLVSLYGVALSQYLKDTSSFRLPDLATSIACLSAFQAKLSSLALPPSLTDTCFDPHNYVNTTAACAGIQTSRDWQDKAGDHATPLDADCRHDLSDLTACDACVLAGFRAHSRLLSVDGNISHAKGCFYYTVLYAAGVVNRHGPKSMGALLCIFGLPMSSLESGSNSVSTSFRALVYGSAGAGASALGVFCLIGLYLWWNSWRSLKSSRVCSSFRIKTGPRWYKIKDLERATDGFSTKNIIGRGQFGIVYKGTLQDGTRVAIKRVLESDVEGNPEFQNEVGITGALKHRNLVPLRGCCVVSEDDSSGDGESQRYLVYDYMPNGSLNDHLFPSDQSPVGAKKPLTWPQRKSIILDVAKALAYLHYGVKPAIYHRDIKPTNILLDEGMRARVADFGLAKQSREGQSHLTTRVAGTHGYLAPEYALYGQLTEKSDVYSFGVVVLEMVCGRKALDLSTSGSPRSFLITDWAWSLVKAGRMEQVLDASLLGDGEMVKGTMERFVLVGILCAHLMVALRPTILEALKMLEGDVEVPVIPDRPVFVDYNVFHPIE
ncbi:probable receptor-like protein kinase At1g11050 [Diospyros lotus]|uniref:probable receptor-like protein kinase At1g11050 n=1 Tax=Diospyros lotus TaxID=55363 RepID=UPI00224EEBDD|nr:probable receptor-like protein kinase At1g11050 [Diospyros lotus]